MRIRGLEFLPFQHNFVDKMSCVNLSDGDDSSRTVNVQLQAVSFVSYRGIVSHCQKLGQKSETQVSSHQQAIDCCVCHVDPLFDCRPTFVVTKICRLHSAIRDNFMHCSYV